MRCRDRRGHAAHLAPLALAAFALLAFLLDGASIPHTHVGADVGVYNLDHDLIAFATFGGGAPVPEGPAASVLDLVVILALVLAVRRPAIPPRRHADPRAPPLR